MGKRSKKVKPNRKNKKSENVQSSFSPPSSKQSSLPKTGNYSVNQLLDKVDEYIDTFQYEMAQKFCQRALEIEPDNIRVLETSGILLLEVGELEKAKQCFGRAITLSPEDGHSKYMYMGQLMTGSESIQYFMKGIDLMKKYIETICANQSLGGACAAEESSNEITHKDVSSAYCSVAEIYLTDECFEDEAENRCVECLDNAIKEDKDNPEAFHLYASYWLSKEQKNKAEEHMKSGLSLWLPAWRDACENLDATADLTHACSLSYPVRINVTKILIELEDYNIASEILELLLDEDDEVVETWYLLGWLNHLQGEDFKQNARYYLGKAQKLAVSTQCEDKDLISHVNELLTQLGGPVEDDPDETCGEVDENGEMDIHSDSDTEPNVNTNSIKDTNNSEDMEH